MANISYAMLWGLPRSAINSAYIHRALTDPRRSALTTRSKPGRNGRAAIDSARWNAPGDGNWGSKPAALAGGRLNVGFDAVYYPLHVGAVDPKAVGDDPVLLFGVLFDERVEAGGAGAEQQPVQQPGAASH